MIMAQKKTGKTGFGNTIVPHKPPQKTRNWFLTLNNYTKSELALLYNKRSDENCIQYCFQEEKGESGTPHLQGVFAHTNAVHFNSIKKLSPRANWKPCRNLKKSLAYCSKAESRIGKTYTYKYEIFNEGKPLTQTDICGELLKQAIEKIDELGNIGL